MRKELLWKISNLIIAVFVFGIGLGKFLGLESYAIWAGSVIVASVLLNFFRLYRIGRRGEEFLRLVLPTLYLLGFFTVLAAVSSLWQRAVLALFGSVLFYFFQASFPKPLPLAGEDLVVLAAAILLLVGIGAIVFFFAYKWCAISLLMAVIFFLLFWQVFFQLGRSGWPGVAMAIVGSLIMVEIGWAVLFLPLHFLSAAVINFAAFYLIYKLSEANFSGRLTRKMVYFHTGIILVVALLSLLSSPWRP